MKLATYIGLFWLLFCPAVQAQPQIFDHEPYDFDSTSEVFDAGKRLVWEIMIWGRQLRQMKQGRPDAEVCLESKAIETEGYFNAAKRALTKLYHQTHAEAATIQRAAGEFYVITVAHSEAGRLRSSSSQCFGNQAANPDVNPEVESEGL